MTKPETEVLKNPDTFTKPEPKKSASVVSSKPLEFTIFNYPGPVCSTAQAIHPLVYKTLDNNQLYGQWYTILVDESMVNE